MSCGSKNASGTLQLQVEDFHVRKPFPKTVPTGASIRRRVNTVIRSREKMTGVRRINYEPVNRYARNTLPGRRPGRRRGTQIMRDPDLLPGSRG